MLINKLHGKQIMECKYFDLKELDKCLEQAYAFKNIQNYQKLQVHPMMVKFL